MTVCGPFREKKLRYEGGAGEVTNINASNDFRFHAFCMFPRHVRAIGAGGSCASFQFQSAGFSRSP